MEEQKVDQVPHKCHGRHRTSFSLRGGYNGGQSNDKEDDKCGKCQSHEDGSLLYTGFGSQEPLALDVHISQTSAADALNQTHFPTYVLRCFYPRINKRVGNMHLPSLSSVRAL